MMLENLFKKIENHFKNNEIKYVFKYMYEIRKKYPLNKRIDNFLVSKKTELQKKSKIISEIKKLHTETNNKVFLNKLKDLIKIEPNNAYLYGLLGDYYGGINEFSKAKVFQEKAIYLSPFEEVFYINLSKTYLKLNLHKLSLEILEMSKVLKPDDLEINLLTARTLINLLRYNDAFKIYNRLIDKYKDKIEIKIEYCNYLLKVKETEKALKILNYIENRNIKYNEIYLLYGVANLNLNLNLEAINYFSKVFNDERLSSDAYTMSGIAYENLKLYDVAIQNHKKALKINEHNYQAYNNLAIAYTFLDKVETSIDLLKKAIEIKPHFYEGVYRLGQLQMLKKQFSEGWKNYESRWLCIDYKQKKLETFKPKLKKFSEGLKVLVWPEQGIGDQIIYGSMFKEISQKTSNLIVQCDKRLISIFQSIHSSVTFYDKETKISEANYDVHIPMADIGAHFRKSEEDFKNAKFPFISGNSKITKNIIKKYKRSKNSLIGISWTSSKATLSSEKSIPLENFKSLFAINGLTFIDLEYKDSEDERFKLQNESGFTIFKENSIDHFNDIEGVTSLIDACDLVITCSNVNAHIAGALNKKTFLLLPLGKGRLWNWSEKNGMSLWYPSIEIIQQEVAQNWEMPIQKLKEKLIK